MKKKFVFVLLFAGAFSMIAGESSAKGKSDFKVEFSDVKEALLTKEPVHSSYKVTYDGKARKHFAIVSSYHKDGEPTLFNFESLEFDGQLVKEYESGQVLRAEQAGTYQYKVFIYLCSEINKISPKCGYGVTSMDDLLRDMKDEGVKPVFSASAKEIRVREPKNEAEEFESALADLAFAMDGAYRHNEYPQSPKEVEGWEGYVQPENMEFSIVQFKEQDKSCLKIRAKNRKTGNESREFKTCNAIR